MKKLGQIGCVVILLFIGLVAVASMTSRTDVSVTPGGAGTAAPAATGTPQAKVGDTVRAGNWEYTVTKVERVPTLVWSGFGNKTDAKGVWLVLSLTLKNVGTRNFGIGHGDFEARDGSGVRYAACDTFACSSWLGQNGLSRISSTEQFPPGVEVKTALAFDINPTAAGLRLVLKQANDATIGVD